MLKRIASLSFLALLICILLLSEGCTFDNIYRDQNPTWSPDGTRIAFSSDRDRKGEIYVMNADGTDQIRLTNNVEDKYGSEWSYDPAWSPDGTKIVYTYGYTPVPGNHRSSIYIMNSDGTNKTALTYNPNDWDEDPSWSPDGSKITFVSHKGGQSIWVMNSDGSAMTRLTDKTGYDSSPSWSPDGEKIAFAHSTNGWQNYQHICIMQADGSEIINLTGDNEYDSEPCWSPDGSKIAFISQRESDYDLYVMNSDGSDLKKITNTPDYKSAPVWSPAGNAIAFEWGNITNDKIYVMNISDLSLKRLTGNSLLIRLGNVWLISILAIIAAMQILIMRRKRLALNGKTSELAVTSFIFGIIGLLGIPLLNWGFATPLASAVAIVFGAVSTKQTGKKQNLKGKKLGLAGISMGISCFIILAVWLAVMIAQGINNLFFGASF
jgi:Tol biopolymer transport system component